MTGSSGQTSEDWSEKGQKTAQSSEVIRKVNIEILKEDIEILKLSNSGKKKIFSPPTQEEVSSQFYLKSKEYDSGWSKIVCDNQAEYFVNFYDSKNWYIGKNKMTNWKAAASGWIRRSFEGNANKAPQKIDQKKSGVDAALEFGNVKMRDDENGN